MKQQHTMKNPHYTTTNTILNVEEQDKTSFMLTASTLSSLQPHVITETLTILRQQGSISPDRERTILDCNPENKATIICQGCKDQKTITAMGCGSRLCAWCNNKRRQQLYGKLKDAVSEYKYPRFLTLSFVNTTTINKEYFKKCQKEFHLFKQNLSRAHHAYNCPCHECKHNSNTTIGYDIGAYVNVLEVKYHKKGEPIYSSTDKKTIIGTYDENQWNSHYHVIFDGDYIPQSTAQDCFSRATGGESYYTYIKACNNQNSIEHPRSALRYITKYLGKVEGHDNDPVVLAEFYTATTGIRFFNKSKNTKSTPKKLLACEQCGSTKWWTIHNTEFSMYQRLTTKPNNDFDTISVTQEDMYVDQENVTYAQLIKYLREQGKTTHEQIIDHFGDVSQLIRTLIANGEIYEPRNGQYHILE